VYFASIPPSSKALFKATSSALENQLQPQYSFFYNSRFRKKTMWRMVLYVYFSFGKRFENDVQQQNQKPKAKGTTVNQKWI
jgi:hypothetical protein